MEGFTLNWGIPKKGTSKELGFTPIKKMSMQKQVLGNNNCIYTYEIVNKKALYTLLFCYFKAGFDGK